MRGERVLDGVRRPQLRGSPPPLQMPVDMAAAYTRCGALRLARMYVDDTFNGNGSHYVFPAAEMARHVSAAEAWVGARWRRRCRVAPLFSWSSAAVALRSESRAGDAQVRASSDGTQGAVDSREARDSLWLHLAHVCVCVRVCVCVCLRMARPHPLCDWNSRLTAPCSFESVCLALGAAHVTTVEYNALTYEHERVTTVVPADMGTGPWDVALSVSSFDHDGLGRCVRCCAHVRVVGGD